MFEEHTILSRIEQSQRAYLRGKRANSRLVFETQSHHRKLEQRKHTFCPVREKPQTKPTT